MSRNLLLESKKENIKQNCHTEKSNHSAAKFVQHSAIQYQCNCDKKNGRHQENCIYNLV
ncbi:MAG: hypothetical protein H3C43_07685 [Leptonema sp. (in: Bacteria)]|nr:hypothetical protein [Leptonema sp. (in: bacteria)]